MWIFAHFLFYSRPLVACCCLCCCLGLLSSFGYIAPVNGVAQAQTEGVKNFIKCVLSTDMASHFANMSHLEQRLNSDKALNRDDPDDRLMIMETVLHSADISNIARPWAVSLKWSEQVTAEFFAQGRAEKERGLQPEVFMDEEKTALDCIAVDKVKNWHCGKT